MRIQINKKGLEYPGTEYVLTDSHRGKYFLFEEDGGYESIVLYYCPICGTEIYGLWKVGRPILTYPRDERPRLEEYFNNLKEEMKEFVGLKNCPICNGTLSHERGFAASCLVLPDQFCSYEDKLWRKSLPNVDSSKIDTQYEKMAFWRNFEDRDAGIKAGNKLCEMFDKPSNTHSSTTIVKSIKDSPNELQRFLQELIDIENTIYGLKKRLFELYINRIKNDRAVKANAYTKKFAKYQVNRETVKEFYEIELKIEEYTGLIDQIKNTGVTKVKKPEPPILQTPSWFNKKKIEAENKKSLTEYHHALEKYETETKRLEYEYLDKLKEAQTKLAYYEAQCNQLQDSISTRIEKEIEIRENKICPEKAIKAILDNEIDTAETILKKLFECRNEMYGMNIVYEKYHNIVALCSFYEYLMSGRCQSLEGAYGAYNLYEDELRSKLIMDKLDNIASSLEKINNNQQMIYSKLTKIHESLDTMKNTMNTAVNFIYKIAENQTQTNKYLAQIAESTDYIAYSTAVNAYYSKVNAQLTNSLGYLIALK